MSAQGSRDVSRALLSPHVLSLVVLGLAVALGGLAVSLVSARVWLVRRRRDVRRGSAQLADVLHAWQVGGPVEPLVALLAAMPPREAVARLTTLSAQRIGAGDRARLGDALADAPWVRTTVARARSPFWWHRLEASRLLAVAARPDDAPRVARLLADRNVAVRIGATACLDRLRLPVLIAQTVRALGVQPEALRRLQIETLRGHWREVEGTLVPLLRADAAPRELAAHLALAAAVGTPGLVPAVLALRAHPAPEVREGVARALATAFSPAGVGALAELLEDDEAAVRARAAQTVGGFGAAALWLIPRLTVMLADRVWAVRFRAALALAGMGERGRAALREARAMPDRYARDMATAISGLSDGAVGELAER